MKRILTRIAIVMLTVLMCLTDMPLNARADDTVMATSLYLNDTIVRKGRTVRIDYSLRPWDEQVSNEFIWKSSDESIATVENGVVTGIKPGDVTIYATTTDGSDITSSCNVWVLNEESEAYAVVTEEGDMVFLRSFDDYSFGDTITDTKGNVYTGKIYSGIESNDYPWWNDNPNVKRAYVAEGSTIYFIDFQNFFYNMVNMTEADLRGFNTERVKYFDYGFSNCKLLKKLDISSFVISGISDTWHMFDACNSLEEIVLGAGINNWTHEGKLPNGNWTNGTVTKSAEDLCKEYPANAEKWAGTWTRKMVTATGIRFAEDEYDVYVNWLMDLELLFTPEDATSPVEYESSDTSVVDLWAEGVVSGESVGTATITARTTDGTNLTATCIVHVIEEPEVVQLEDFKFTKKEYEVPQYGTVDLEYEFTPEGANLDVTNWVSSDPSVAEAWFGRAYGNKPGTVTITVTDEEGNVYDSCTVTVTEAEPWAGRVFGSNRYKTSMAIAEAFRDWFTDGKNENIILACGTNFADALAGSYLSAVKWSPIIIINDANIDRVKEYVKTSLEKDGTVYILGGEVAVSAKVEKEMKKVATNVKRLAGSNRYDTNLKILEEAGMNVDTILVATGTNFADSLSASAAGLPMLLVKDSLNDDQKAFLKKNKDKTIYILGGTSAVNATVEKQLKEYGKVRRIAGSSRFETSVMIAEKFFDDPYYAMVAFSNDYPDGLCGGPIGVVLGAPLILTRSDNLTAATQYCKDHGIKNLIVFGGEARLTDKNIKTLLNSKKVDITKYEYKGD